MTFLSEKRERKNGGKNTLLKLITTFIVPETQEQKTNRIASCAIITEFVEYCLTGH